jgi:hypothetical protein
MWRKTRSHRGGLIPAFVSALALTAGTLAAQDSAVILGGGRVGTWSTTGFVANASESGIRLTVTPFEGPCPAACVLPTARVAAHGSLSLETCSPRSAPMRPQPSRRFI